MSLDTLVGGWRPERWEWSSGATGTRVYSTRHLAGLLIYAGDGTMAVHVRSTRGAPEALRSTRWGCGLVLTVKALLVATPGFRWGYSGRYVVEEARGQILHHVEARSLWAARGSILRRNYELKGDRLCLEFEVAGSRDRLIWRRAVPAAREQCDAEICAEGSER